MEESCGQTVVGNTVISRPFLEQRHRHFHLIGQSYREHFRVNKYTILCDQAVVGSTVILRPSLEQGHRRLHLLTHACQCH